MKQVTTQTKWLAGIAGVFIISRIFFWWLGVRFNAAPLADGWHYLDPAILKDRLLESLWYLHSQPPLFNLFLGVIIKLCSPHEVLAFQVVYIASGLCFALGLFTIMTRMQLSHRMSALFVLVLSVGPVWVFNENALLYDYPVTILLTASIGVLQRALERQRSLDYSVFFGILATLVLIRSLFHIGWFIVGVVGLLALQKLYWKRILAAAAIPFLVIVLLYVKNFVLFDSLSSSTWLGISLAKLTLPQISVTERQRLIQQREVSPIVLIRPFSELPAYVSVIDFPQPTNIPALDQSFKSTGFVNYNHLAYIAISRQYQKDVLHIITTHPAAYLRSLRKAFARYWESPASLPIHYHNILAILPTYNFYNATLYAPLVAGVLLFIAILYGGVVVVNMLRGRLHDHSQAILILFMWFNILYVTIVSNVLEFGENNRFRFTIEPFVFIMVGIVWERLSSAIRNRDES